MRGAVMLLSLFGLLAGSCRSGEEDSMKELDQYEIERHAMVDNQLARRNITDERVLAAMRRVPRHLFVPEGKRHQAYDDHPLPIGNGQTISQPYIVAYMTQAIRPQPDHKVLEIGTGSGYQAAVLAEVVGEVYSIEIIEELGQEAAAALSSTGYDRIHLRIGDGYMGWAEAAPFDAILLTAAPPEVPQPLLDQLKVGGLLVAPVGIHTQDLICFRRTEQGWERRDLLPVRFVPMTGKAQE